MSTTGDFLLHLSNDVEVAGGDFVIGNATLNHQANLLHAGEGEFRESPSTGVGIRSFLLAESPDDLLRKVRRQFESDGMKIELLKWSDVNGLHINARYK